MKMFYYLLSTVLVMIFYRMSHKDLTNIIIVVYSTSLNFLICIIKLIFVLDLKYFKLLFNFKYEK